MHDAERIIPAARTCGKCSRWSRLPYRRAGYCPEHENPTMAWETCPRWSGRGAERNSRVAKNKGRASALPHQEGQERINPPALPESMRNRGNAEGNQGKSGPGAATPSPLEQPTARRVAMESILPHPEKCQSLPHISKQFCPECLCRGYVFPLTHDEGEDIYGCDSCFRMFWPDQLEERWRQLEQRFKDAARQRQRDKVKEAVSHAN